MTSLEHSLIGIQCALALGIQRRFGWRGVALAGVSSVIPDWDGLPMLFDMGRFESAHRVWGHSILVMVIVSMLVAYVQVRWDPLGWLAAKSWKQATATTEILGAAGTAEPRRLTPCAAYSIALFAQVLHIPWDMVVSGGAGLSNWLVVPWWPFSRTGYAYPMVPWGDPGAIVILMTGAIAEAKRRRSVSLTAGLTLGILVGYLVARRCS